MLLLIRIIIISFTLYSLHFFLFSVTSCPEDRNMSWLHVFRSSSSQLVSSRLFFTFILQSSSPLLCRRHFSCDKRRIGKNGRVSRKRVKRRIERLHHYSNERGRNESKEKSEKETRRERITQLTYEQTEHKRFLLPSFQVLESFLTFSSNHSIKNESRVTVVGRKRSEKTSMISFYDSYYVSGLLVVFLVSSYLLYWTKHRSTKLASSHCRSVQSTYAWVVHSVRYSALGIYSLLLMKIVWNEYINLQELIVPLQHELNLVISCCLLNYCYFISQESNFYFNHLM